MFLIVSVSLCFCLIMYLFNCKIKTHLPPTIKGSIPIIGHVHLISVDTIKIWKFMQRLSKECLEVGGAATLKLFYSNVYVLTDPESCSTVAKQCYDKSYFYHFANFLFGEGLLTAKESTWKKHRKLLNPAFNQSVLDGFTDLFNSQAKKLIKTLSTEDGKGPINQMDFVKNHFLETVFTTIIGIKDDENQFIVKRYFEAIEKFQEKMLERVSRVWLHIPILYNYSNLKKEMNELAEVSHVLAQKIINTKKNYLNNKKSSEEKTGTKFKAFLDLLMEYYPDILNDKQIRDEVDTILVAGYETTTYSMTFILLLLGSHKHVQNKLFNELKDVGVIDVDITKQDLSKLPYLDAVIKESLRLYTPAPVFLRHVDRVINLGKWILQENSTALISVYGLHRHSAWGPDADQFRPERWLDQSTPDTSLYYAPFGLGKRNCIGKAYAMMALKITLVHLVRHYEMSGDMKNLVCKFEATLKPFSGYNVAMKSRN